MIPAIKRVWSLNKTPTKYHNFETLTMNAARIGQSEHVSTCKKDSVLLEDSRQ